MGLFTASQSVHPIVDLPAWVYTAVADNAKPSVVVPYGRYELPTYFNGYERSNLDFDGNGSSLYLNPAEVNGANYYPFRFLSVIDAYAPGGAIRDASHLTGTVTSGTTQLTMHASEIVDVQPGEIVQLLLGVGVGDPVEPAVFQFATVLTVSGQVITFTEALGVNITVYANEAALQAVVSPDQYTKIGPWGDDFQGTTFKKGLGADHGLLRFNGGSARHDLTFRNWNIQVVLPPDNLLDPGQQIFQVWDYLRVSFYNIYIRNVIKTAFHTIHCDDVLGDGITVRGEGRAALFPDVSVAGDFMQTWGGNRITYRNVNIQATNLTLGNTEVGPRNIKFENLHYQSHFNHSWNLENPAVVLSFAGRIEDSTLLITGTGSSDVVIGSGSPVTFENLVLGAFFPDFFNFALYVIEGTLTVNNLVYGPLVVDTETVVRTATVNDNQIVFPVGFYKAARFRVTVPGSLTGIGDGFGNSYDAAIGSGAWTVLATNSWIQVPDGAPSLAAYFANAFINFHWTGGGGGASATLEFEVSYYPRAGGAGWVMD